MIRRDKKGEGSRRWREECLEDFGGRHTSSRMRDESGEMMRKIKGVKRVEEEDLRESETRREGKVKSH